MRQMSSAKKSPNKDSSIFGHRIQTLTSIGNNSERKREIYAFGSSQKALPESNMLANALSARSPVQKVSDSFLASMEAQVTECSGPKEAQTAQSDHNENSSAIFVASRPNRTPPSKSSSNNTGGFNELVSQRQEEFSPGTSPLFRQTSIEEGDSAPEGNQEAKGEDNYPRFMMTEREESAKKGENNGYFSTQVDNQNASRFPHNISTVDQATSRSGFPLEQSICTKDSRHNRSSSTSFSIGSSTAIVPLQNQLNEPSFLSIHLCTNDPQHLLIHRDNSQPIFYRENNQFFIQGDHQDQLGQRDSSFELHSVYSNKENRGVSAAQLYSGRSGKSGAPRDSFRSVLAHQEVAGAPTKHQFAKGAPSKLILEMNSPVNNGNGHQPSLFRSNSISRLRGNGSKNQTPKKPIRNQLKRIDKKAEVASVCCSSHVPWNNRKKIIQQKQIN